VNTARKFQFSQKAGHFLISRVTTTFSRMTLLQKVILSVIHDNIKINKQLK